jgi:hypothetical protein
MNQSTDEQKKESLTKILAIAGFLAIIIFAVWLAVQIVSILPSAFSSLASLADSVYNYDKEAEFEVATEKSVVNAGESFTITWTQLDGEGAYTFSYKCVDGVAIDIRKDGEILSVACDTAVDLGNVTSLEVQVQSEKARFVDIPYTITWSKTNSDDVVTKEATITVANASIPTGGVATDDEDEDDETPTAQPATPAAPTTPVKKPTYTAGTPVTITKLVYTIPASDPKGTIDLQVTFLGVGTLVGKTFVPKAVLDADDQNALQFEVKNIGTKTAQDWSYEANLPAGISYEGDDQKELKPNERAVITLGFDGLTRDGSEKISVEVTAKNDIKKSNNEFTKTIKIID